MEIDPNEVRYRLTLTWPTFPPSDDLTEDNPLFTRQRFIDDLWKDYYLGDEWGDEATFAARRNIADDGTVIVTLESTMPEAMGEVMKMFAMEMSYHWAVGTNCKFERVNQ